MTDFDVTACGLLADIRAAAGDPKGKLMQPELLHRIRALAECEKTLRLIAEKPRKTKEQRLAKACIAFLDSITEHRAA